MFFEKYLLSFLAIMFIYGSSYCDSRVNEIYENNELSNSLLGMEDVFLRNDDDLILNPHNDTNWSADPNKCKCINGRCETACAEWKNGACIKTKQACVCYPEFGKYDGRYEEKIHEYRCIYCNCGKGFNCTFDFKRPPGNEKVCICPEGYYDHNGECAEFCSESRPCQNGGKCQNGKCKCQSSETSGPFCERVYQCGYMCTPRNTADCVYNQVKQTYDCLCKNRSLVYDYQEELCKPCPCGEGTCVEGTVHDFKCECRAGYQEFKKQCKKCDCGPDQHCELHWKTGEKICACKQGYFEREGICLPCDCGHKDATCKLDNVGRKVCICPKGYEYNFGLCKKNKRENCTCHPTAKCNETDDGFTCLCEDGYMGQIHERPEPEPGEPCIDIDECLMMAECKGEYQKCINFEGSFMCQCITGYQPVGGTDEFGNIKCEKYKVSWAPTGITIGVILAFLVASAGFLIFLKKRESSSVGSSGFELRFSRR